MDELEEELPLITKDEYIRLESLTLSVTSFSPEEKRPAGHTELAIIERARYFEQYIRNGAFEKNAG